MSAPPPLPFALPQGTTVLEASAGTGKTFTIAGLVTRYVAEDAARLDELLVVTFGRAATQELRDRVRERLVSARDGLADPIGARASSDELLARRGQQPLRRDLIRPFVCFTRSATNFSTAS